MTTANNQLPCDGEGKCMVCGTKPSEAETLFCSTCATPWHAECLAIRPESLTSTLQWECPDCDGSSAPVSDVIASGSAPPAAVAISEAGGGSLVASIRAIEADATLTEQEKARRRQTLLSGGNCGSGEDLNQNPRDDNDILSILGENLKCSFCMQLPDRPVTTPCGHNFCLKCFEKWIKQGKKTCAKCRKTFPVKMLSQPKINSSLVFAIRMARMPSAGNVDAPRVIQFVDDAELPDKAFTTVRAVKKGNANAKSGRIFVTIPNDHFGPILAEYDPVKKTGVLVGDSWTDRLACRQWGAHFPAIAGIAGQAKHGAQSVVLSGGYEDDEDHGEWFLYTGSGGRDLSRNRRTNKEQSSDQEFTDKNAALLLNCLKGYPVRVIRSWKDVHSNYAPEGVVRYDGIYRIEKCWVKFGKKGFKLCRYLFVRCDNSAAPWTGDEHGDRPRPLPCVPELEGAIDITERKETPHWDFDENDNCWKWKKPQPMSKLYRKKDGKIGIRSASRKSSKEKILKEFSCLLCRKVMSLPITTPCAHNFCKLCLDGAFAGQSFLRERNRNGRQLRTQKNVMKCPACTTDIAEFLQNAEVNRELMGVIESILKKFEDEKDSAAVDETPAADEEDADEDDADEEDADEEDAGEEDSDSEDPEGLDSESGENVGDGHPKEAEPEPEHEPEPSDVIDKAKCAPAANKKRGASTSAAVGGAQRGPKSQKTARGESPSSPLQLKTATK